MTGFDFDERQPPDGAGVWGAIVRLYRFLSKRDVTLQGVSLTTGRNTISHGQRGRGIPSFVAVTVRGDTPVGHSVGPVTDRSVAVYVAADCNADILVRFDA